MPKWIGWCSLAVLGALYVVGAVSNGSLRHKVKTLPLWFPVVSGFRQREHVKLYPAFQKYFRDWRPAFFAIWLRLDDPYFIPAGAEAFLPDGPNAHVHFLETGILRWRRI